jgi:hypothetical protein
MQIFDLRDMLNNLSSHFLIVLTLPSLFQLNDAWNSNLNDFRSFGITRRCFNTFQEFAKVIIFTKVNEPAYVIISWVVDVRSSRNDLKSSN